MTHALTEEHEHREIDDRLLPWPKVKDITGLSRTTAWRLQKGGDFPLPVVISPGRVGWRESELQAWKASRAPRPASALPEIDRSFAPEKRPREAIAPPPADLPIVRKAAQPKRRSSTPDQMSFGF